MADVMSEARPLEYFSADDFAESLVLSITHKPDDARLVVAVAYVDLPNLLTYLERPDRDICTSCDPPAREFRVLCFAGVSGLQRTGALYKPGFKGFNPSDVNLQAQSGLNVTIDWIQVAPSGSRFAAILSLGSLGVYSFEFSALHVAQRIGLSALDEDPDAMRDATTGERFEFHRPFAQVVE